MTRRPIVTCVVLCSGLAALAGPPETAPATGPWSAGSSVAATSAPSISSSAPELSQAPPAGDGDEFFVVPIPRSDPALGSGLIGAAAYIFKLDRDDRESPPSVLGAAAFLFHFS